MSLQIIKSPNPSVLAIDIGSAPKCMDSFSRVSMIQADFGASAFATHVTGNEGLKIISVNNVDLISEGNSMQVSLGLKTFQWNGFKGSRAIDKVMSLLETFDKESLIKPNDVKSDFERLKQLNAESLTTRIVVDVLKMPVIQDKLAEDGGALIVDEVIYDSKTNTFDAILISVGSCSGCTKAKPETMKNIVELVKSSLEGYRKNAPEGHPMKTVKFAGIKEREMTKSFYQLKAQIA